MGKHSKGDKISFLSEDYGIGAALFFAVNNCDEIVEIEEEEEKHFGEDREDQKVEDRNIEEEENDCFDIQCCKRDEASG